jgi:tRNA (cytidine/uridine-2'-O-)-methyltransferase
MIKDHLHVCLLWPEIPQNTGNIGRLVAATQCRLHLIRPFAFGVSDKNLRRAGLDYWPFLDLEIHDSIEPLLEEFRGKTAFLSKKGTKFHTDIPREVKLLVFGQETKGLPDTLWKGREEEFYRIPIFHEGVRSLNLANSVSIVLYHQLHACGRW